MGQTDHFAIIVAAGKGLRMGSAVRKQYLLLGGIPILSRTVMAFHSSDDIRKIILVVPEDDIEYCKSRILEPHGLDSGIQVIAGGDHRQASVFNALKTIRDDLGPSRDAIVMIHDGVRPFVNQEMIRDCIRSVIQWRACVPAVKVFDTIKQVSSDLMIEKTLDRHNLYQIQTPQCFYLNSIVEAFEYAAKTSFTGTDDASILEHSGGKVYAIKGSRLNIKITTPEDMMLGELLLSGM